MQGASVKTKKAFTLIEVIVVSLIVALLGIGLVTVLVWMFGSSREDQQRAHLQTQANIVHEILSRNVHNSSHVSSPTVSSIQLVTGGASSGTFSFSGDTLKQNNKVFAVAGRPVLVKSDSSFFNADSSQGFVNTRLVLRRDNVRYVLHTGVLRCRN